MYILYLSASLGNLYSVVFDSNGPPSKFVPLFFCNLEIFHFCPPFSPCLYVCLSVCLWLRVCTNKSLPTLHVTHLFQDGFSARCLKTRRNLCTKLQKVDEGDPHVIRCAKFDVTYACFCHFKHELRQMKHRTEKRFSPL